MKDVFLVYDKSCFYEIVILNYFMSFSNCDMVFCSLDGKPVRTMEGFSVNVDMPLEALEKDQIRSFILPGGNIAEIDTPEVKSYLQALMKRAISQLKLRRSWICSPVKMIFRKQSTSGNIIKECSSTEVAVEYLRQITEDNFMEAFNLKLANGQERFVSHPIRSLA